MSLVKHFIKSIPIIGPALVKWIEKKRLKNINSQEYWKSRYKQGGNSGAGSYNRLAEFKAQVLNEFTRTNNISKVIEFGSGDGNQLRYFRFPEYLGYDISSAAVETCRDLYRSDPSKSFHVIGQSNIEKAELTISLDVIYHLLEDEIFDEYMRRLFQSSTKFVIVYSSNKEDEGHTSAHVKHRKFTDWVSQYQSDFDLIERIPNAYPHNGDEQETSFADFFVFKRRLEHGESTFI